ncbi:MAG: MarR family transcriptional regulator [Alphaproteobacteria bacterium]|nr:MarR family transcriptional regulator [Alphaproteobacteria bacterium]
MLPLDDYVPYLLNRAGARIAQAFSEDMRALGTTLQAWRVLAALRDRDNQRVSELADHTSIEISTLSRVLDGMQKQGLIARRRAEDDGRVVTLHVTPAGRRLTDRIVPIAERYERTAISGLSATETATLKRLLRRLYANMDGLRDDGRAAD